VCGIAGRLELDGSTPVDRDLVERMTNALRHRGPDEGGTWVEGPVGLGARRLAIIDLSPLGHQPMTNEDGSLTVVFNGEIYNFLELRAELQAKGHPFRSGSDTETILHLYEEEGVECVRRLWGMFAFALWDARSRTLLLARDRLGKKPLFYACHGSAFLFGSEPKAILQDRTFRARPDPVAIHHFLASGCVPSPWSAFVGIRKLPPAHYMVVQDGRIRLEEYWKLSYAPKRTESADALGEELVALLEDAVRRRLVSDVPLGALLSGGMDSSTVVALMRRVSSGAVRTFSIGFDRAEYDELGFARQVARHFETEHHELVVKADSMADMPRLVWYYGEPFGDSSALPSMALCELARRHVTVALSGDGGDESFVGYERYLAMRLGVWCDRLMPLTVRLAFPRVTRRVVGGRESRRMRNFRRFTDALALGDHRRHSRWRTTFDRSAWASLYEPAFASLVSEHDPIALLDEAFATSDAQDPVEKAAHADVKRYLPDDLLVKMDIASMAHSLEVRSPFLDHRVVEFAAHLPLHLKLRGLTKKYLLKRVMRGVLPKPVRRRAKMGFGVPIEHWFRQELYGVAHDVLLGSRASQRGYFRMDVVRRLLAEHGEGRARHEVLLWNLLMLELWHGTFIDQPCPLEPPG
jgi:asparagine synthase (glutamine-hydrolysing)